MGRRVSELRLAIGLTQAELADAIGETLTYVQRLEAGRQKLVSVREMVRVAQALNATVIALLTAPTLPRRGRGRPMRRTFE
jgi:transcriptional regulator with XRE-family HTH domain